MNYIDPPKLLGKIQKNHREEIRISLDTFRGYELINLRVWFRADDGVMRPGKNGIAFRTELLSEILTLLTEAKIILSDLGEA